MSPAMSHDEVTRVRGTDREGPQQATPPVCGPPQHAAYLGSGSPGNVMASEKSTHVWEAAYRQYGHAWERSARAGRGDPAAAREMAAASWAVAAAWRQIAATTTLPWWTLAALESAASAFESQAHDYDTRDTREGS